MPYCVDGVVKNHYRSDGCHYFADAFALCRGVAVCGAFAARSLACHVWAVVEPCVCIAEQFVAFGAKGAVGGVVIFTAVEGYHFPYYVSFAIEFTHYECKDSDFLCNFVG